MARTYHLLQDLGVRKELLVTNFYDNDRPAELNNVRDLLALRTQSYTLAEIELLFGFLITAHDECVDENPEDYEPLQVFTARAKIQRADKAMVKLAELKAQESPLKQVDAYLVAHTGFKNLDELINAKGGYIPTICVGLAHENDCDQIIRTMVADAYDAAQAARNDSRRAYRTGL